MFGTVLTLAVTLLHLYVFVRAVTVPALTRHVPRRAVLGFGFLLWLGFLLARFVAHGRDGAPAAALELAGMAWMASLFLAAVCLLAVDLITGFGFWSRRTAPWLRGWALAAGAALSALALVQGLRPPVVDRYDVHLAGLPPELDGTVIVALSDLHLGSVLDGAWARKRVAQVRAEGPDLVVLLGDSVEGHGGAEADSAAALAGLEAPLGVWAVLGNHESHRGSPGAEVLVGNGIRVLRDEWVEVRPGLVLSGVEDLTRARRNGPSEGVVANALARRPQGATVLLSHTPWGIERAAASGAELMLCGHTHGGQIWPFGYLVKTRYPFLEGRYEVGGMTVLVSRGAGTWGPRMRLWRPGQILRVTLHPEPGRPPEGVALSSP